MDVKTDSNPEEKLVADAAMATTEEPLGSLTISDVPELKGQQLRSSARVFKKMKLDVSASLVVPEKSEKKEETKQDTKKCFKPLWSSDDKTLFFEALNEYGKDFENIHQYISSKFRKKGVPDQFIKTKDQIRHLYYRTWSKISKYLKFAEGIKRLTQELYGLINYGELRKKIGSVNEKYLYHLNKLIYKGAIMVKIKGKNIRIKTPFCRALRRLNQLDDKYEEVQLPNRLSIELRPKDMTSYLRVQSTAQNPRIRTYMPLQKRLSCIIDCLSKKWQSIEAGMYEKALNSTNPATSNYKPPENLIEENKNQLNPLLRITPPVGCKIEVPSISLGEYFTRQSISLNAHETRLGISKYSSYCNYSTYKLMNKGSKKGSRPRTDSVSDKSDKSPQKTNSHNEDDTCDTVDAEIKDGGKDGNAKDGGKGVGISVKQEIEDASEETKVTVEEKVNEANDTGEIERQERITAIKRGWTKKDSESVTLGEIYLMFGQNSRLILEYSWDSPVLTSPETDPIKTEINTEIPFSTPSPEPTPNLDLSEPLQKLLSVAKLHYRKNIIKCPCGHVCGAKNNAQLKRDVETKIRKILTDIDKCAEETDKIRNDEPIFENSNGGTFVTPPVYPKMTINPYLQANAMQLASQIASIQRLTPRYCNRKGRRPRSKQVVVERQLPLLPNNVESGHQIVRMNIISKEDPNPPPETHSEPKTILSSNIFNQQPSTSTDFDIKPEDVLAETCSMVDLEPCSPTRILKEGEHWINSEVGDYSLSSLLGHLESPIKSGTNILNDDSRMSQDVDAQLRSMLAQNSIDFSASFADLAAEVARDTKCELG